MRSHTAERFRKLFQALPKDVQRRARNSYRFFAQDPFHLGLHYKQVHPTLPIYSVRIELHYRAVGTRRGNVMVWFWIGSHEDYDHLLSQM